MDAEFAGIYYFFLSSEVFILSSAELCWTNQVQFMKVVQLVIDKA